MSVKLINSSTLVSQQLELDLWQILAVAQTEPVTVGFIALCGHLDGLNLVDGGEMLLVELQQKSGLNLVDLWLGLLLGDTGCSIRRQLSGEVEFSIDFYDRAGIWIVEFVTGEKEDKV